MCIPNSCFVLSRVGRNISLLSMQCRLGNYICDFRYVINSPSSRNKEHIIHKYSVCIPHSLYRSTIQNVYRLIWDIIYIITRCVYFKLDVHAFLTSQEKVVILYVWHSLPATRTKHMKKVIFPNMLTEECVHSLPGVLAWSIEVKQQYIFYLIIKPCSCVLWLISPSIVTT